MIASVATAVKIEITGAMAIIHGTAVSGDEDSFESSLNTSASGCMSPLGPTRLGPIRDWKRPRSLRSSSRISGHDLEDEGEDHDRLHDHHEGALHQEAAPMRPAEAAGSAGCAPMLSSARSRAGATSTGPSGSTPGGVRNTLPGGTPVRTRAVACARSPATVSSTWSPDSTPSARASSGASSDVRGGREEAERARVLDLAAGPERRRGCERSAPRWPAAAYPAASPGRSSTASAARRLAVLPAHPAAADLVERQRRRRTAPRRRARRSPPAGTAAPCRHRAARRARPARSSPGRTSPA